MRMDSGDTPRPGRREPSPQTFTKTHVIMLWIDLYRPPCAAGQAIGLRIMMIQQSPRSKPPTVTTRRREERGRWGANRPQHSAGSIQGPGRCAAAACGHAPMMIMMTARRRCAPCGHLPIGFTRSLRTVWSLHAHYTQAVHPGHYTIITMCGAFTARPSSCAAARSIMITREAVCGSGAGRQARPPA